MILEDFFTLTEMKNGLATLTRVEELISIMKEQKASASNYVGEAARQCSTCACTLVATENQDCLSHFVALNGLCFINKWLQEALKCGYDVAESTTEDLVRALLSSLEKLPVDREKPSASETRSTVEQLLDHRCRTIRDQARSLLDKWNDENAAACEDYQLKLSGSKTSDRAPAVLPVADIDQCKDSSIDASCGVQSSEFSARKDSECRYGEDNHSLSSSCKPLKKTGVPCDIDPEGTHDEKSSPVRSLKIPVLSCITANITDIKSSMLSSVLDVRKDIDDAADNGSRKADVSPYKFQEREMEDMANDDKDLHCDGNLEAGKKLELVILDTSSKSMEEKGCSAIEQKSDMDLECGEIDALEVARQVAIEVEREVVDYREPLCSSSPEISSGEIKDTREPDPFDRNQQKSVDSRFGDEISAGNNPSDGTSNLKDDSSVKSEKIEHVAGKDEEGSGMPMPTTIVHEPESKIDENRRDFDLNKDMHIEEYDSNTIPSNPVTVSVVKGAPDFAINQLQFEGVMGWKGSATTSAFRPASPRRTPDGEKTYSVPMQKTSFPEFDLNIAENEETYEKPMPLSSGILYRGLSSKVSSVRAEKPKLDLNRVEDVEVSPHPSSFQWNVHCHKEDQTSSPASSSSSRHPSIRDFDLNDNPSPLDPGVPCGAHQPFWKVPGLCVGSKLDDLVATIIDSRMVVERKDSAYQAPQQHYENGFRIESSLLNRPLPPYANMAPPAYGYNGQPTWSYPPTVYGPRTIPYIVDARGIPVVPQMLGTTGFPGAPPVAPPFPMTLAGTPSSSKGFGASHLGLDLNSGVAVMDGGSKEANNGFRQFLLPGQNGLIEAQSGNLGATLKRKEPDSGRDPTYTLGCKQMRLW